jgi:hypothetical protein
MTRHEEAPASRRMMRPSTCFTSASGESVGPRRPAAAVRTGGSWPHVSSIYVVGGGGAGPDRNPSVRDFPLVNANVASRRLPTWLRCCRLVDDAIGASTHLLVPARDMQLMAW